MIRPWYRSSLFWLGLPGLAFLAFAWFHSYRVAEGLRYVEKHRQWTLASTGGYLCLVHLEAERPHSTFVGGLGWRTGPGNTRTDGDLPLFGAPVVWDRFNPKTYSLVVSRSLGIAHWLLLATYLGAWVLALAGWRRHQRRRLETLACEAGGERRSSGRSKPGLPG